MPPLPEHYITDEAGTVIQQYLDAARHAHASGRAFPEFPEADVASFLDNTWRDSARAIFDNWLGLVYQLTNLDRRLPFREGIDPKHPLRGLMRS